MIARISNITTYVDGSANDVTIELDTESDFYSPDVADDLMRRVKDAWHELVEGDAVVFEDDLEEALEEVEGE